MSTTLLNLPPPRQQFLDSNGKPLAGGFVYTYVPSSTTPKQTFQDYLGGTANANPITLDSAGSWPIFGQGAFRLLVKDVNFNVIEDGVSVVGPGATSDGVTWQGPYSGNIVETLTVKLDQLLSVQDFGAVQGEDCSGAVQLAVSQAGYAYFPDGNWVINSAVNVPQDSAIFGLSPRANISSALTTGIFLVGSTNTVTFENLTFVGTAADVLAISCYETAVNIKSCFFNGCSVQLNTCFTSSLGDLYFAPSSTQPAGQLRLQDDVVNSNNSRDSILAGVIYEGSYGGNTGVPSDLCIQMKGCTRWNVSNVTMQVYNVSETCDLIQVSGPSNGINFSGLSLTGGNNGLNITGANGAPSAVGGAPSSITVTGSNFQGQYTAGVRVKGYEYSSGNYNRPAAISVVGNQFGVGSQPTSGVPACGILADTVLQCSFTANQFYLGPQINDPSAGSCGIDMNACIQMFVEGNTFNGITDGVLLPTCQTTTIQANRFYDVTTPIGTVPGAIRPSTDPLFSTPYLNVIRGNFPGNPPAPISYPTIIEGTVFLNDSGYDCQVLMGTTSSKIFTLQGTYTFEGGGGDLICQCAVGVTLEWVSGGSGGGWEWFGQ